jgi:hypothetical protein
LAGGGFHQAFGLPRVFVLAEMGDDDIGAFPGKQQPVRYRKVSFKDSSKSGKQASVRR